MKSLVVAFALLGFAYSASAQKGELSTAKINYEKYVLKYNDKTNSIIASIIYKSKLIPKKSLNSQSFVKFCRSILAIGDYNILKANLEAFEYIYSNIY